MVKGRVREKCPPVVAMKHREKRKGGAWKRILTLPGHIPSDPPPSRPHLLATMKALTPIIIQL